MVKTMFFSLDLQIHYLNRSIHSFVSRVMYKVNLLLNFCLCHNVDLST